MVEQAQLAAHEIRIARLEDQMSEVRIMLTRMEHSMQETNKSTQAIRDSTDELVTLTKGIRLVGRIAAWGGAVTTFAAALYAAVNFTPR